MQTAYKLYSQYSDLLQIQDNEAFCRLCNTLRVANKRKNLSENSKKYKLNEKIVRKLSNVIN